MPSHAGDLAHTSRTYSEYLPPSHLLQHIVCVWHRPGGVPPSSQPILPDGCIDIIWAGEAPPIVAGPMTVPLPPSIGGAEEIVGVRFRPGVAPFLLGVSAAELRNRHVPLADLWAGGRERVWRRAAEPGHVAARIDAITDVISDRLALTAPPDPFVAEAARWMAQRPTGSLDTLVSRSGLSERQVRRRFVEAVGYGPKTLQRILRLQRLFWLASGLPVAERRLAELALAAGYADQSHMTREVTALTGSMPSVILRERVASAVSVLFKTPPR